MTDRKFQRSVVWLLVYICLCLFIFRESLSSPFTTVPTGPTYAATVPLLNMWTIWWNCEQLRQSFPGYWDAPIFFPERGTFAFSEPQPILMLFAPVYWLTGSLAFTYKVWLILGLSLNGLLSYLFLRSLEVESFLAGTGGIMIVMLPAIFRELDAVQITHIWPVIWTLLAYRQLLQYPSLCRGIQSGFAFGACFLVSVHQGFLFTMIIGIAGIIPLCFQRRQKVWKSAAIGVLVATAMIAPLANSMRGRLEKQSFVRSESTVARNSAAPQDYLRRPTRVMEEEHPKRGRSLSVGVTKYCLAIVAMAGILRLRKRPWTLVLFALATTSFAFSLGPNLSVCGIQPWSVMYDALPWVQKIRSPIRFAIMAQMSIVFLAVIGLHEICIIFGRGSGREVRRLAMFFCAAVATLESLPPSIPIVRVGDDRVPIKWAGALEQLSRPGDGVLCLPMTSGPSVRSLEVEARWMLVGTQHHCHLVNGYSGFFPAQYVSFAAEVADRGLTQKSLDQLRGYGVQWIAVERSWKWRPNLLTLIGNPKPVYTGDGDVDLFRIGLPTL